MGFLYIKLFPKTRNPYPEKYPDFDYSVIILNT
jgi:hypothetical protein